MSRSRRARSTRPTRSATTSVEDESLAILHPNAAGVDLSVDEVWVSVRPDRDPFPLRAFGMTTPDLVAVAEWLQTCQVETVAMESTSVYWIPLYEILDARGFQVFLVNAREAKNLPGRKRDETDAQWLRRLHTVGLLRNSFRPADEMCALRAYLRHRADLIEHRAAHIQHMQKALHQMNVRLSPTVKDITGVTGMAILRAILAGERDPVRLAALRQPGCDHSEAEFVKALTGNYRDEHLFALKQAMALYDAYTAQIQECDQELECKFSAFKPVHAGDLPPLDPPRKAGTPSKNAPSYDARTLLYHMLGIDLTAVDGLNAVTAQTILSEIGTDMTRWTDVKHFCSWLSLAPHNETSGGKVLRRRTLRTHNRAGQAFRLAARSVARTQTAYGEFFRHMRARLGPQKAIVATAHKIARAVYYMLRDHQPFQPVTAEVYAQKKRERDIARLHKNAAKLGFTLSPAPA
jgi:transposase